MADDHYYHVIAIRPGDRRKSVTNRSEDEVLTQFVIPFVSSGTIKTRWGEKTQSYQILELRVYRTKRAFDRRTGRTLEEAGGATLVEAAHATTRSSSTRHTTGSNSIHSKRAFNKAAPTPWPRHHPPASAPAGSGSRRLEFIPEHLADPSVSVPSEATREVYPHGAGAGDGFSASARAARGRRASLQVELGCLSDRRWPVPRG